MSTISCMRLLFISKLRYNRCAYKGGDEMNKRKKLQFMLCFQGMILIICMLHMKMNGNTTSELQQQIDVMVHNKLIEMDAPPYMKEDRIMVSVRTIAEVLKAKITWNPEWREILISKDAIQIALYLDKKEAFVMGEKKNLDVACEISNHRTMVPVRFITEALGVSIYWDTNTRMLKIEKDGLEDASEDLRFKSYTEEDLLWLGRIIEVEGKFTSLESKLAIANVVLNRKKHSAYPDTIREVIFDTAYGAQFPPAYKNGFQILKPSNQSITAAKMALEGENNIENCLYFSNVPFKSKSKKLFRIIDRQYFYR